MFSSFFKSIFLSNSWFLKFCSSNFSFNSVTSFDNLAVSVSFWSFTSSFFLRFFTVSSKIFSNLFWLSFSDIVLSLIAMIDFSRISILFLYSFKIDSVSWLSLFLIFNSLRISDFFSVKEYSFSFKILKSFSSLWIKIWFSLFFILVFSISSSMGNNSDSNFDISLNLFWFS